MIDHHIQKRVIRLLVENENARYSDLKPKNIEGNVFSYHLQNLIKRELIAKDSEGSYYLTSIGKLYGINSSTKNKDILSQAHSIILLSVKENNKWLLRKRLVQPMYGKIGFMHGEPMAGETIFESAKRILEYRCGLNGVFKVRGTGFICIKEREELVAYSNFTLLEGTDLTGVFYEKDSHGENTWYENPDFSSQEMIPSMLDMVSKIERPDMFFLDKTYSIDSL